MSESSWSLVFTEGDSNSLDGSASTEELLNGPLLGSETEVSNEDGSDIFATFSGTLWLVATGSLSGELNPDGSAIEGLLIGALLGLSSGSVVVVFNEGFALVEEELNLGQSTVCLEHASEGFLGGIEGKTLSEELHLAGVLILNIFSWGSILLGHGGLSGGLLGLWLLGLIRVGTGSGIGGILLGSLLWCWLLRVGRRSGV